MNKSRHCSVAFYASLFAAALTWWISPQLLHAQESAAKATQPSKPLRALLIAGGCCHDYAGQQEAIQEGIQALANVQVDVYWTDNSSTAPLFPLYTQLNWAETYDVIIHDECAADVKDPALVQRIVAVHQKIPAVHLHCAMHSFRTGGDAWFKHLGLQSSGHGPQQPIDITFVDTDHPITETLSDWTTIREELYNNVKLFDAHPIAKGIQRIPGNPPRVAEAVVAWTNEAQGARSFSTTIGHNTETVRDPRYLELVTRGLLWACDKLNDDYLTPFAGDSNTTFIDKNKYKRRPASDLGQMPKDATLVKLKASSTQNGHPTHHAIDGKSDTRWCASGGSFPQWLQLEFAKPHRVNALHLVWEFPERSYQYRIEGSADGKAWQPLGKPVFETSGDATASLSADTPVKFIRITGIAATGGWCSIRELTVKAEGITKLWPAEPSNNDKFEPLQGDPYAWGGNSKPRIEKLTPQQEAEILRDVTVPEGFEATVFAAPPAVNYPVFVAASVDGTLYVSSDGNGSLGRDPMRGRVIRLRDTDGDGRADETKVFCEVDAPRGLVWDRDRLYLMHPPNLSVFFDHDGDGVADEQKTLVRNLAFDYDDRPADHTTNGLSLGPDGWLYIAGGDFGFMNAEGTDGRRLTHRGGGVLRVRPDGTGLELYSAGTRNILEVAISPSLDLFARDNTNDGGGWDVRFHHFTGGEDHGYPRLYKNFADECVPPLADYGGGSGCGAAYLSEPGYGDWNNAPLTADWGTGAIYHHQVEPAGATFRETRPPQPLVKMTRPTDADVDGNSRLYAASWRGATFKWNGPDVGYIVCVKPKDFEPAPMPNFDQASDEELTELFNSPSYRRRLAAQRELVHRGNKDAAAQLYQRAIADRTPARQLLEDLQTTASVADCIAALTHEDPLVVHTAIHCLADRNAYTACFAALDAGQISADPLLRALAMMHRPEVVEGLIQRLENAAKDQAAGLLATLCRLHYLEGEWKGNSWGTRPDTRGPYYQPEAWEETERIAALLQQQVASSTPERAAWLLETMRRNRIDSDQTLQRMIARAQADPAWAGPALQQLAVADSIPASALEVIAKVVHQEQPDAPLLTNALIALTRGQQWGSATLTNANPVANELAGNELAGNELAGALLLSALERIQAAPSAAKQLPPAIAAVRRTPWLDQSVALFANGTAADNPQLARWSAAMLLTIAERSGASPETRLMAEQQIASGWQTTEGRIRLIAAAGLMESHYLDEQVWAAREDADAAVSKAALGLIEQLKIKPAVPDNSPQIATLQPAEAKSAILALQGDANLGRRVFAKANCSTCHTITQAEEQKGPYLGNIAKTYKRPDLIDAVLDPNKTIAQGFTTNSFLTIDGQVLTGFVTNEQSDRVVIRDAEGKSITLMKDDIEVRRKLKTSVMPTGLLDNFTTQEAASLMTYLESLAQ